MAQIAGNRASWDQARMYIVLKARDSWGLKTGRKTVLLQQLTLGKATAE
jgi:hypothetical protein